MFQKIEFIFILFLSTGFTSNTFAGWDDHVPVPVNSFANPGDVNDHYNSGGRRIVRINNTIIVICPHGTGERTYRSLNNGISWEEIDQDGAFSGCLITGPGETVYHFYRSGDRIYMVRFKYNESPPAPVIIYTDQYLSEGGHGAYNMLTATVDKDGELYVVTHWDNQNTGGGDTLYLIRSNDGGNTWTPANSAIVIQPGSSEHSWGYAHLDVSENNKLLCVFSEWGSNSIQFAHSPDKGASWSISAIASGSIFNPAVLPVGDNTIYVFAQSALPLPVHGLVFNKSIDSGVSWDGWKAIDSTSLSGYADPSPGLGSNGEILVAYRSGARPDLADVWGGDGCRERFAVSTDGGIRWIFPDDYFYDAVGQPTERTGTRSQIRYQTWFNYGGPLEWIWMQYEDPEGTNKPIYYDINTDITMKSHENEGVIPPTPPPPGGDYSLISIYLLLLPVLIQRE
jgi:hypothetical protein